MRLTTLYFKLSLILCFPIIGSCAENIDRSDVEVNSSPNIILIVADDLGYGDIQPFGQQRIKTPNLNRLATDGIKFTQHYAGSTVCGPSRASLLTGLHSGHSSIRGNPIWTDSGKPVDLTSQDTTLASMLQDNGYNTAVIGKWGLAEQAPTNLNAMPNAQGFDYFFGYKTHIAAHHYYWPTLFENNNEYPLKGNDYLNNEGKYTHDLFTEKAIDYIRQNGKNGLPSNTTKQPFFLYLAYTIPHLALTVPEDAKNQYKDLGWPKRKLNVDGHYRNDVEGNVTYAAMVSRMDRDIGKLMQTLKDQGIDDNTLVIFTSDNGHEYDNGFFNSNGPLRGKKRDLYEGGIRVPFIARWPNKIQANSTSDHISAFWDYFTTFCDISKSASKTCANTDGVSFINALTTQQSQAQHEYLYWEFNEKQGPLQALRKGDWKLLKKHPNKFELYNLHDDIGEQHNLATQNPEKLNELQDLLENSRSPHPEFSLKKLPNPWKNRNNK